MHPAFLGDSYDIVKRFFCEALRRLDYTVYINPMLTGEWSGQENAFFRFLGVTPCVATQPPATPAALFFDPDTGVNRMGGPRHVSYEQLVKEAQKYEIVFAFDQGFSRSGVAASLLQEKLGAVHSLGCAAMYYDSHARFLFVSQQREHLQRLRADLLSHDVASARLVERGT
jgi:hypothetical protein